MAIRNRHGIYDKFIPDKLVPGEFAFVRSGDPNAKDGKSIYASFDAGTTKRLATYEDMKENIALAADDVVNEVAEELNAATDRANTSAVEAEAAAVDATNAAEEAKHAIAGSKSPVYKSDGWPEVGEEGRLYIDDTVSPRLIYTWDDEKGYVKTGGSGGGNATVEEMTWAEYEALSEAEKMDGTLRVITDRKAGVRFGNVDISGIGDGTVTGAINALNSKRPVSLYKGMGFTGTTTNYELITTVTIPGKSFYVLSAYINYGNSKPTGVRICYKNEYQDTAAWQEQDTSHDANEVRCQINGYTEVDITFHIFGKWHVAAKNSAYVSGFYIPA